MVQYMGFTTIQLEISTKQKLERFKEYKRETFNETVNKLIRMAELLEKEKKIEKLSSALLSEKSLAKDWLGFEEEKAWANL